MGIIQTIKNTINKIIRRKPKQQTQITDIIPTPTTQEYTQEPITTIQTPIQETITPKKETIQQEKIKVTLPKPIKTPIQQPTLKTKISAPHIRTILDKIDDQKISRITLTPALTEAEQKTQYIKLLKQGSKVITLYKPNGEIDQQLLDIIYKNRSKLQHRFGAVLRIYNQKNQLAGEMEVQNILPEQAMTAIETQELQPGNKIDYLYETLLKVGAFLENIYNAKAQTPITYTKEKGIIIGNSQATATFI